MATQADVKTEMTWLDREFMDGYFDGRDKSAPEPSDNRSAAYRHSFAVGRAELAGCPIPAALSRERAALIEAAESLGPTTIRKDLHGDG